MSNKIKTNVSNFNVRIHEGVRAVQIITEAGQVVAEVPSGSLKIAVLLAGAPKLMEACRDFVEKVERGEARSVRSYAQMKAAIEAAEGK